MRKMCKTDKSFSKILEDNIFKFASEVKSM